MFRKFKEYMDSLPPALVTDQDLAIKASIIQDMSDSVHRFCTWHIIEKMPIKISGVDKKEKLMKTFNNCVWHMESPSKFESTWATIIDNNHLQGKKWLSEIFEIHQY